MIARPSRLEDWTIALVHEIAASGTSENDWYDLKADLQGKADHQRKVVAAFANTQGGFLVFGVTDDRRVVGLDSPELPRDFGNKLIHGLNPSVAFRFATPLPVAGGAAIWVCEVPRSQRGPHGVLMNDHWVFPRRTESGSNVSMNVEEVRGAFLDSGRRQNELAWLRAEVDRIRDLAERVNQQASVGAISDHDLVLTRFDVAQIRTLLVSVFGFIGKNPRLVEQLHAMIERCSKVDAALAPVAAFAALPKDRSYSGAGGGWRSLLLTNLPEIAITARLVIRLLDG